MLYLATAATQPVRDAMTAGHLGQLVTPGSNVLEPGVVWALDNGCFTAAWDETRWLATLDRYAGRPRCAFAAVPDVVGDAKATDARWARYVAAVRARGYTPAYVTQNGCTAIPDDAGALFTGGDDHWKLGPDALDLTREAQARGLWTHMGRVNTLRRLRVATRDGYDSVDGTFLTYGPDQNLPRLLGYLRRTSTQPALFG